MEPIYIELEAVSRSSSDETIARGRASRLGFSLTWTAYRASAESSWEVEVNHEQVGGEHDGATYEIVTGDDHRAFTQAVAAELRRHEQRRGA